MTAEEAAEIVRMALAEAGYPEAGVVIIDDPRGGLNIGVQLVVPWRVIHRAFELLTHARRQEYPSYDEWKAHHFSWPRVKPWWYRPFDAEQAARS